MPVREVHKKWQELQAVVTSADHLALGLLRHPDTTPEQLVSLHASISRQAVQMRDTQLKLRKLYRDSIFFTF
jgi:hypothetical protein